MVVREFGPPNVMRLEELPDPTPGPGEVVIRVHAVSVNRTLDTVVRAGKFKRRVTLPLVPGIDPAGVIVALGPGVPGRRGGGGREGPRGGSARRALDAGAERVGGRWTAARGRSCLGRLCGILQGPSRRNDPGSGRSRLSYRDGRRASCAHGLP